MRDICNTGLLIDIQFMIISEVIDCKENHPSYADENVAFMPTIRAICEVTSHLYILETIVESGITYKALGLSHSPLIFTNS